MFMISMETEPHGAVGWAGRKHFTEIAEISHYVFLETAHPAKFPEEINSLLGFELNFQRQ